MAVNSSQIQNMIKDVSQQIQQAYEGLSLFFVVHRAGQMRESIALAEHEIISHRAGVAARAIIRKHSNSEKSSFLGLAISSKKTMFGFKRQDMLLGLLNINVDEFQTELEARAKIYSLAWHAIDLYEIRQKPQYRKKFKDGPMVPKRSDMNLAKANLQADSFAAILSALRGEQDLLPHISKSCAQDTLRSLHNNSKPEDMPFVIALDACRLVIEDLKNDTVAEQDYFTVARNLSVDIGHAFDEESIRQWWSFTIPAQDMAWRGFSQEHILSAAIHSSADPFVRSIGYLVQDVTKVETVNSQLLDNSYNAFIDPSLLSKRHKEMVDTIFEDAVVKGLAESSNRALLNAANKLNEALVEGQIMGWCSNALQDAAQAFERALLNGASPDQAARMQFEGNKNHPKWDTLKKLGKDIVDQKRQGFAVTMGHIAEICHSNDTFAPVLDSLKITMNDPAYIQKLEAANDFSIRPAAPSAAPKTPALGPKGPGPALDGPALSAPAPSGPSLGGNNRGAQILRQRQLAAQKQAADQSSNAGDEST